MIISFLKADFVDSPLVNNRFPLCFVFFCQNNALEREGFFLRYRCESDLKVNGMVKASRTVGIHFVHPSAPRRGATS